MKQFSICIFVLILTACHSQRVASYSDLAGVYTLHGFRSREQFVKYSLRLEPDSTFCIMWDLFSNRGVWKIVGDSVILKCYKPKDLMDLIAGRFNQEIFAYKILKRGRLQYLPNVQLNILKRTNEPSCTNDRISYSGLQGTYVGKSVANGVVYNYTLQLMPDSTFYFKECTANYSYYYKGKFSFSGDGINLLPYDLPLSSEDYENDEKLRLYQSHHFIILDNMDLKYSQSIFSGVLKRKKKR